LNPNDKIFVSFQTCKSQIAVRTEFTGTEFEFIGANTKQCNAG